MNNKFNEFHFRYIMVDVDILKTYLSISQQNKTKSICMTYGTRGKFFEFGWRDPLK